MCCRLFGLTIHHYCHFPRHFGTTSKLFGFMSENSQTVRKRLLFHKTSQTVEKLIDNLCTLHCARAMVPSCGGFHLGTVQTRFGWNFWIVLTQLRNNVGRGIQWGQGAQDGRGGGHLKTTTAVVRKALPGMVNEQCLSCNTISTGRQSSNTRGRNGTFKATLSNSFLHRITNQISTHCLEIICHQLVSTPLFVLLFR